jgi:hypothetical protein
MATLYNRVAAWINPKHIKVRRDGNTVYINIAGKEHTITFYNLQEPVELEVSAHVVEFVNVSYFRRTGKRIERSYYSTVIAFENKLNEDHRISPYKLCEFRTDIQDALNALKSLADLPMPTDKQLQLLVYQALIQACKESKYKTATYTQWESTWFNLLDQFDMVYLPRDIFKTLAAKYLEAGYADAIERNGQYGSFNVFKPSQKGLTRWNQHTGQ